MTRKEVFTPGEVTEHFKSALPPGHDIRVFCVENQSFTVKRTNKVLVARLLQPNDVWNVLCGIRIGIGLD
jgi:hypothetical protein